MNKKSEENLNTKVNSSISVLCWYHKNSKSALATWYIYKKICSSRGLRRDKREKNPSGISLFASLTLPKVPDSSPITTAS